MSLSPVTALTPASPGQGHLHTTEPSEQLAWQDFMFRGHALSYFRCSPPQSLRLWLSLAFLETYMLFFSDPLVAQELLNKTPSKKHFKFSARLSKLA